MKTKGNTSQISTIIGISLVLFMLGMVGWIVLSANTLTKNAKENIRIDIFFKEKTKENEIRQIEKTLLTEKYIKSADYISKDEALQETKKIWGDDIEEGLFGYNPIWASLEIYIKSDWANLDSVQNIEAMLMAEYADAIQEISYNKNMFKHINENAKMLLYMVLVFSALLLLVAIALINNTIRLTIYAKRLLIKSMQLVGATERFIRKPFMLRALINGIIAGLLSMMLITGVMYYAINWWPDLKQITELKQIIILFAGVILLGIIISWTSTYFALRKYLRIKSDYLF
jgi:cell division transport system permease protein